MATIGKRINGENDKPERYALIYVEGEQDLNINITGDGSLLIVTHEVALYAKNLTISMTAQGQRSVDCESYGACVIVKHDLVVKDNS